MIIVIVVAVAPTYLVLALGLVVFVALGWTALRFSDNHHAVIRNDWFLNRRGYYELTRNDRFLNRHDYDERRGNDRSDRDRWSA